MRAPSSSYPVLLCVVLFGALLPRAMSAHPFESDTTVVVTVSAKPSASSQLREPKKADDFYAPKRAFDGRVETAWCSKSGRDGAGEWLQFSFAARMLRGVALLNGYGRSGVLYEANNRIRRLEIEARRAGRVLARKRVELSPNRCVVRTGECPQSHCLNKFCRGMDLERCYAQKGKQLQRCERVDWLRRAIREPCGWHDGIPGACAEGVTVGEEVELFSKGTCADTIRIRIVDVYRGKRYRDTCIAEVAPFLRREVDRAEPCK